MKLLLTQNEHGDVLVTLGDQVLPGVTHVAFTASVDDPRGRALLEIVDLDVQVQLDGQLLDIRSTPLDQIPGLEVQDEELWIGSMALEDLDRLQPGTIADQACDDQALPEGHIRELTGLDPYDQSE